MRNLVFTLFLVCITSMIAGGGSPVPGGGLNRNNVNPTDRRLPERWNVKSGENIKWTAELGSTTYGSPVVSGGKVFVSTNNDKPRDPKLTGDKGNLMCFSESDGKFLWQAVHDKLSSGPANDWPNQGIGSSPFVEGERLYYVSNRCELMCLDTEGRYDGENDGPVKDESHQGKEHADIVWRYDMIEELGVFPHNLATSSPLVAGDLVFLLTGNGVDESHVKLPSPHAPSFIAVNKKTGKLAWAFAETGKIVHGQWSSPAYGTVKGKKMAIFPGGDGWVYALEPEKGKLIWKFDCNPKNAEWQPGGYGTRNNLIASPVIHDGKVYIGVGQDPEHGPGPGNLWCIDASGSGDVTATHAVWRRGGQELGRTMSTVSIQDGLLYVPELEGFLNCLDAETGKLIWRHDLFASVWGSTMVAGSKIYIGDEDGDVAVLRHGKELKELAEINMGNAIYTTPTVAGGVLYIATNSRLFAIHLVK